MEFGKALTLAESEEGKGRLSLLRWRDGNTGSIVIQLPVLGTYGPTAPFDCPKSARILKLGCEALAKWMLDPESHGNAITRSLNALALLASGNEQYLPLIKREAKWAAGYHTTASQTWWYGYVITFLSEYVMATGDESVMPGLKGGNDELHIDAATAKSLIEDGKGWTRHDRNEFYGSLSEAELLERLDSWSPIVRERAAIALAMKSEAPIDKLLEKLHADRLESRLGACQAFAKLGARASPALSELRQTLQADDIWLRVQAAEAIAAMGEAGMPALPELLEQMARNGPSDKDPRGMEQRFLSFAVFTTMLKKHSLKGVDRDLLRKAIAVSLRNEDGKARTAAASLYDRLTYDELRPLLPAIYDAIVEPAPSGIMFADGVRINGLQLLARQQDPRAPRLALDLMEINRWGKRGRVEGCIKALEMVGDAAKPLLPELRQLEKDLKSHREANTNVLKPSIERLEKLIKTLEGS